MVLKIKSSFILFVTSFLTVIFIKSFFISTYSYLFGGIIFQTAINDFIPNIDSWLLVITICFALIVLYSANIIFSRLFTMVLIPKQVEMVDNWLNDKLKDKKILSKILYTFIFYSPLIFIFSSFLRFFIWNDPFIETLILGQPMYMMRGGRAAMEMATNSDKAMSKFNSRFFSVFLEKGQKTFATISALQFNTIIDKCTEVKNFDSNFSTFRNFTFNLSYRLENLFVLPSNLAYCDSFNGGTEIQSSLKFAEDLVRAPKASVPEMDLFKTAQNLSTIFEANEFRETLTSIRSLYRSEEDFTGRSKKISRRMLISNLKTLLFTPMVLEYNSFANVHPNKPNFGVRGLGIQQVLLENFNLLLEMDKVSPEIKLGLFHVWCTSEGRIVQNLLQMICAYITATDRCEEMNAELLFISALPTKFTGYCGEKSKFFTSVGDFIFYFKYKGAVTKTVLTEIIELKQTLRFIDILEFNKKSELYNQIYQEYVDPKMIKMRKNVTEFLNFLPRRPTNHNVVILTPNEKFVLPYIYTDQENIVPSKVRYLEHK